MCREGAVSTPNGFRHMWSGTAHQELRHPRQLKRLQGRRVLSRGWGMCGLLVLFVLAVPSASSAKKRGPHLTAPIRLPLIEGKGIRFTHLSTEQGLSQSRVDHILQDDQGFIWFGTYNGLNRYDGYRFRAYKPEAKNPNSLGGVFVTTLFKDRSGVLWIGTDQGLDRFDPVTETFTHFRSNPNDPASLAGHLEHMTQDRDGMLWLATRNGLDELDPITFKFTHHRNDPNNPRSLSSNDVRFVLEDKQGTLWVATATDLNAFDRRTENVVRYPNFQEVPLDRIFEDRSGMLWVSSTRAGGLASLDRKSGEFTRYTFFDEGPHAPGMRGCSAIHEDQYGMLWLATKPDGVVKFDRQRREFTRYRNDPSDPDSLNNNDALSLQEDHEGGIWVGTDGGGVNRFSSGPSPFITYRKEHGNRNSLDQSYVLSVFEDSQRILWIGTSQLNRLDRTSGRYRVYRHDPSDGGSIANGTVHATVEDRSGFLWFGTWGGGLNRFDRRTGRFKAYRHNPADPGSLSHDFILTLYLDHAGMLWVGTEDGVNRFNPRTQRFTVYRNAYNAPPSRIYRVIAEGADGSMWLGTYERGLQHLDVRTGEIVTYMNDPKIQGSLSNNRVNALCVDKSGTLWVGTQNGLNRFDPMTGEFTVLNQRDGLPNNAVQGILEDAHGNLWLGTGSGLSKFDPRAKSFKNYYADDGLAGDEFSNSSVYYKSASGEMFFGGVNGITAFYPDKVVDSRYIPPVALEDFRLFNNRVPVGGKSPLQKSISYTESLTLSHEQNIFSLEFSSLSYDSPQRNRYRYKLEGLEETWNETGSNQRLVTYTTLPPGYYTFRVQGSSSRGVWNQQGIALQIHILPPWWSTWRFRMVAALVLSAILWLAYYLRVRSVERRNRELTEVNLELQRSQGALQASEERHRLAREAARLGTFEADVQAQSIRWPAETEALWGLEPGSFDGTYEMFFSLIHPEDRERIEGLVRQANAAGNGRGEWRIVWPDGTIRWIASRWRVYKDERGEPARAFGINVDVTDRKQAEIELQASEERYRTLIASLDVIVWEADARTWQFTFVSSGAEQILGYPAQQWLSEPNFWVNHLHAADRELAVRFCTDATRRGKDHEFEYRAVASDGRIVWLNDIVHVVKDAEGRPTYLKGVMVDITGRKQAEIELQDSEQRYRSVVAAMAEGVVVQDARGEIVACNQSARNILGLTAEQLLGQNSVDRQALTIREDGSMFPGEAHPSMVALRTGRRQSNVCMGVQRPDRDLRWILINAEPIVQSEGAIPYAVVTTFTDITERRQSEEAQQRLNRELARQVAERTAAEEEIKALSERLINAQEEERARIARELHDDLNQQIAGISLSLGIVRRKLPQSQSEAVTQLEKIRARLSRLSNSVRSLSHELHPVVLDYWDIAAALRAHCKEFSSLSSVNVSFETEGAFDDVPENVAICLYRVAQEGLQNVAKHSGADSAYVRLFRAERSVSLTIADHGAGFRVDQIPGFGLGLVSIKERVRLVKGKVSLQSEPQRGTTLTIEVPVKRGIVVAAAEPGAPSLQD